MDAVCEILNNSNEYGNFFFRRIFPFINHKLPQFLTLKIPQKCDPILVTL